jgi:hypothetical protein
MRSMLRRGAAFSLCSRVQRAVTLQEWRRGASGWRSCIIGACAATALVVTGCSGGGSDVTVAEVNVLQDAPTVSTTATPTQVEASIPKAASDKVSTVLALGGTGSVGGSVKMPDSTTGASPMGLALDAEGNTVLAGRIENGALKFSVESTALALAKIALGPVPNGMTVSNIDEVVLESVRFAALKDAVSSALAAGQSPGVSSAVNAVAGEVAAQAALAIEARLGATRPKAFPDALAALPLPHYLYGKQGDLFAVFMENFSGPRIKNTTAIFWSVQPEGSAEIILEPADMLAVLRDRAWSALGPDGVNLPANAGKPFGLVLTQSSLSKQKNIALLVKYAVSTTAMLLVGRLDGETQDCIGPFIEAAAASDNLGFDPQRDFDVLGSLWDAAGSPNAWLTATVRCGYDEQAFKSTLRAVLRKLLVAANVAEIANDTATISSAVRQMARAGTYPVGVCTENSSPFNIVNCAVEFKADLRPMAPGAEQDIDLRALDIGGAPTALPGGLIYTALTPDVASIDGATGQVRARSVGLARFRVTEPKTEFFSEISGRVQRPVLTPSSATINPGQTLTLALESPDGGPILVSRGGTVGFTSSNASVARVQQFSIGSGALISAGSTPGSAMITAADLQNNWQATSTVNAVPVPTCLFNPQSYKTILSTLTSVGKIEVEATLCDGQIRAGKTYRLDELVAFRIISPGQFGAICVLPSSSPNHSFLGTLATGWLGIGRICTGLYGSPPSTPCNLGDLGLSDVSVRVTRDATRPDGEILGTLGFWFELWTADLAPFPGRGDIRCYQQRSGDVLFSGRPIVN